MRLEDLDFELPRELVAQHPVQKRDASRLLRLRRGVNHGTGRPDGPGEPFLSEHSFHDLPELLRPGDVLVRNVSRVLPARLAGEKLGTGARCEILLLEPAAPGRWWTLVRPARRLPAGSQVRLRDGTTVRIVEKADAGERLLAFPEGTDPLALAQRLGVLPLPPYIHRPVEPADADRYQTVYARVDGSLAAPTAGLHFTSALLQELQARDVTCVDLVLHIGPGTFTPLRDADPRAHRMHWERFAIERGVISRLEAARAAGGRVVAVGTTSARVLESVALWEECGSHPDVELREEEGGLLRGRTRLFIYPPFHFRRFDVLLTNFHLPRSTLLLLVDAFAGREAIRAAYAHAVAQRYRFFSYGDAMLIE